VDETAIREVDKSMPAMPNVRIVRDAAAVGSAAADIVASVVSDNPGCAICVPTGSTPLGMFAELIARVEAGTLTFDHTHIFCLDEYVGVTPDDPNSLTGWLQASFLRPARVPAANVHTLPAVATDLATASARYEREIVAHGGLELAVLGLGGNGHIAYNEPGSRGDSRTRVLDLTPESLEQARGYFGGRKVPTQAMTVGVGTLLEARQIVLIVHGASKADILRQALHGPETSDVPASFLRRAGDRVLVIADEAAAPR
jgi:glucosamine-6-phosphate deaminase